jgi:hypothetical protein
LTQERSFCVFSQTTLYVHLIVEQSNNGESLSRTVDPKPKRHNATLLDGRKRQAIITGLANGESKRGIARRLSVSPNSVTAVADQEWSQVAARKQRLAAQAERNALVAGEQITEALHQRKYTPTALVPVYGVSLDKALALRSDDISTIHHLHSIDLSDDDLIAFAVARSRKRPQAAVAEVPKLTA